MAQPKLRILIAEDCRISQLVATSFVESLGFTADVVANGREVLEALDQQTYDLILMDCEMPEMDGYETAKRIVKKFAGQPRPRIIAVTAHVGDVDADKCLASGMDGIICKPIEIDFFAKALSSEAELAARRGLSPLRPPKVSSTVPAFDRAAFLGNFEGLDDLVQMSISRFLALIPSMMESLDVAIQANDFAALAHNGHKMKGSVSNFRAEPARLLAYRLEKIGSGELQADARETFNELIFEMDRLAKALQVLADERKSA